MEAGLLQPVQTKRGRTQLCLKDQASGDDRQIANLANREAPVQGQDPKSGVGGLESHCKSNSSSTKRLNSDDHPAGTKDIRRGKEGECDGGGRGKVVFRKVPRKRQYWCVLPLNEPAGEEKGTDISKSKSIG